MSARSSRLAGALFAVLSAGVALNMTVMQPKAGRETAAGESLWGAVGETAALAAPEIDTPPMQSPAAGAAADRVTDAPPGIGQRIVVAPPEVDVRALTRDIQTALAAKGYETGGTDGIAGAVTQAAIVAYETDNGLPLTAEPSEALLQMIRDGRPFPAAGGLQAPGPKAESLIRSVQASLAKLGYNAGRADGRLGEATIAAIRAFEKQQAMPDTGRISGDLVTRLTRLSAQGRTADKR